jgi:aryl carrier-like protein
LSELASEATAVATPGGVAKSGLVRESVLAAAPHERSALLETYLREQLGRVLGRSPAKLDVLQPLNRLGLDSLMAVEMKNRIEIDIGVLIPMVRLLQGPSLAQIAGQLSERLDNGEEVARPAPVAAPAQSASDLLAKLDEMSDEEVVAMLNQLQPDTEASV